MSHVCPWWFCYTFDNPLRRLVHDPVKMLAPYVGAGATCLDLGCGMGYFTIGLARLVGSEGRVLAVDLQEKMLDGLRARARKAGLTKAIEPRRCGPDDLGLGDLAGQVDFALCFWMLHEVPDMAGFLAQIATALKPTGTLLVAEPKMHVKRADFDAQMGLAAGMGWRKNAEPPIWGSHAALLQAPEERLRAANYQAGRSA